MRSARVGSILALIFFCMVTAPSVFGSASNIYITPTGSAAGNCTTSVQTPTFFNTAANWGSGANQIGPGTTVLLCGTFTSSVQGGNVLTVQGSGAAGNPVTILFDSNTQMTSTGWWGTYNADACAGCTGAITINGYNYITVDGGSNGIIQNTLSGTSGNTCAAGPCTLQPGNAGSLGIHIDGDYITVRNLTIQGIYMNAGSSSSASDQGGIATADIRVDGPATNLMIYNNKLFSARAGLWGGFNGSTGPDSCPAANVTNPTGSGVCIFGNTVSDHAWQMTLNSVGSSNIVNVYNNTIGDAAGLSGWLNWQYPTNLYHQDGIFVWGSGTNQVVTAYIYNNQIEGDLGQGSPSGMIYCANTGSSDGSGCAMTVYNNLVVGTGSAATNDQIIAVKLDETGVNMGPIKLYNNTFIGGEFTMELYNEPGDASFALTAENNIFYPGSSGNTRWFYHQENGGSPISSITASNNDYYNGSSLAWNFNGSQNGTLATWQSACGCDSTSIISNPALNGSYLPTASSPFLTLGSLLTALNLTSLDSDKAGNLRPLLGPWTAGAYNLTNGPAAVGSLTGSVQSKN